MSFFRRALALFLLFPILINLTPAAKGCGPSFIEPIFVFKESPDLPFSEFAGGRIGIVQPGFGRKTLVIAYRYLNHSSFGSEEQKALVEALQGKAPEDDGTDAVKTWVAGRKGFLQEGEKLPEIYTERQYGGYDFFPNCTKNAFEVAAQTLKDRVASYGANDKNVRSWLAAQDTVFQNCGGGATIPAELGAGNPEWLRLDREYQIGAALLYSLNFDEARARFEKIAADNESPWQQTGDYLVARTLVRQASFARDAARKHELYEQAEAHLQRLLVKGGKFSNASQRLLGLVEYRFRPEERVRNLARILATQNGNENLRQDLIDYVWLLDKFEAEVWKEEAERREAQKPDGERRQPEAGFFNKDARERYEAIQRGDLIDITLDLRKPDGTPDYSKWFHLDFKYDASEDQILQTFEIELGRKLTSEEAKQIREKRDSALSHRKWRLSPNQKWTLGLYEGGYYQRSEKLTPDLVPAFLRADELTDWIFTLESAEPAAYAHAVSKWRASESTAWLLAALTKSHATSSGVERLLRAAERVGRDVPAFPSVAYHIVRLKVELGRKAEARKLLDDIISWQPGVLPISAQNQFLQQRMELAANVSEFLRFAQRRPITFYEEGTHGKLSDFLEIRKSYWIDGSKQTKEEYERKTEETFRELLLWDDRFAFDEKTVEILNWHFPLQALSEAARDPALPDYLRRRMALAVWTRAILLKHEEIALPVARDVVKLAPEMASIFLAYLSARTAQERRNAALYILLKHPMLSPFVTGGLPTNETSEELDYYFESAWWCAPSDTDYNDEGNQVTKVVAKPAFLTDEQLAAAGREHAALVAIGDAKSYLGKRVTEWARLSPADDHLPESLFIAASANRQYKYGCEGWEFDQTTKQEAETILRRNYPRSEWAAKLEELPD